MKKKNAFLGFLVDVKDTWVKTREKRKFMTRHAFMGMPPVISGRYYEMKKRRKHK